MIDETRQMSFRCSEEFYSKFQERKRIMCLGTSELVNQALQEYFQRIDDVNGASASTVVEVVKPFWAKPEDERLVRELFKYVEDLPGRKRELVIESLALDAKHYKSARLSGTRFQTRFKGPGDPAQGRED